MPDEEQAQEKGQVYITEERAKAIEARLISSYSQRIAQLETALAYTDADLSDAQQQVKRLEEELAEKERDIAWLRSVEHPEPDASGEPSEAQRADFIDESEITADPQEGPDNGSTTKEGPDGPEEARP